jgi:hypothetical protein
MRPGVGYAIQTYSGDGNPLPSFESDPYAVHLGRGTLDTAINIWNCLNVDNRVAIVVQAIDLSTGQLAGQSMHNEYA